MIIIGIGTGRSGTLSLSRILSSCGDVEVSHERKIFRVPFYDRDPVFAYDIIRRLRAEADSGRCIVGDVSYMHLGMILNYKIIEPEIKIICIHRDKESTVNSWLNKCGGKSRCYHLDRSSLKDNYWNKFFPLFPLAKSSRDAWGQYWDYYENYAANIDNAFHINIDEFSNDGKLNEMYDYVGIKNKVFPAKRIFNRAEYK